MEFRKLGDSGLKVSITGLGGNTFGGRWADEQTSAKIIAHAIDSGINFLDTADIYSQGHSEEIIGRAVKGKRASVIIASKFGHPIALPPEKQGGSRSYILNAVEASLKRLNTDYIDLYYFHFPDEQTPILETLRTMDNLIRTGKVRYIACSNFAGWQLSEAEWTSRAHYLDRFIAVQSKYNMLDRGIESEVVPCCQHYGISVIPWGPLAGGFLTGKYQQGKKIPEGVRLSVPSGMYRDVFSDANYDKIVKLEAFAIQHNHTLGELAIAWLLSHPWLGSVIAGVTSAEQVTANIRASEWKLNEVDLAVINKII